MEQQYLETLQDVLGTGVDTENRTGVDTRAVFGRQMRFNLSEGFPALTTKRLAWRAVVSELLWFLEGSTDERRLCEIQHGTRDPSKNTIWRANADEQGKALGYENTDSVKELGPVYGAQWRNFDGVDQIEWVTTPQAAD
jgi:thymidylate synthase